MSDNIKLRKDGKPKRKPGPRKNNIEARSDRSTRRQIQAKPQNDKIREELITAILSGQYNPKLIYDLSKTYSFGVNQIRAIAEQAFQLIKLLQSHSDDPAEAKTAIKADINQKLHNIFELSIKKQDYRTANQILVSIGKLNAVFDPEKIEITNSPIMELTQAELIYIRETGKLPQTVLADWQFNTNAEPKQLIESNERNEETEAEEAEIEL